MSITSTMYTAASGMDSFTKAISVVSDNVANVNTIGYKANEVLFADLVGASYSTLAGTANRAGTGTTLLAMRSDFTQGPVMSTSNWADVALNGDGYLVMVPPGTATDGITSVAGAAQYYTRDGSLHVDENGFLVNSQGYQAVGYDGTVIQIETDAANPAYSDYYVEADGKIYGMPVDGSEPVQIDEFRVSTFPDQEGLVRQGGNLYVQGPYSGNPIDGTAGADGNGKIMARSLENSNVDMTRELVNMVIYQADFTANTKSITVGKEMFDTINSLVR